MSLFRARIRLRRSISLVDVLLVAGLGALIYALVGVAQEWASPFHAKTEIELGGFALVRYSFLSLVRVTCGYILSLAFTLSYGYVAAKSRVAEPVLISLLDILQSVPVLGFMPGLVLALVSLFPKSNFGLELAAIVMIFTGQGWNMVFSYYSSLKGVPVELREMTRVFRLTKLDVLRTVELPFAANGLLWNSMMSMAGGWFFLMVIESFTLGDRDFRLPGIGSYMAVAYERGDTTAIALGVVAMFLLIVIVDRCVWAPLVVWSERFRFEREGAGAGTRSIVLDWLTRSEIPVLFGKLTAVVKREWAKRFPLDRLPRRMPWQTARWHRGWRVVRLALAVVGLAAIVYGFYSMYRLASAVGGTVWVSFIRDTGVTLLRVTAATLLGALWTVPLGVFIGTHPLWTRRLQPLVQIVASFPAPMLFPVLTGFFVAIGLSIEVGAVILMLFACQWYILFNVIAGATLIPHQMIELAQVFRIRRIDYWRAIVLPAIFPSLVNGLITAAGGAWNACIVAELVQHGSGTLAATGIGSTITLAAQRGDYAVLAGAVLVMVTTVVLLNRFLWGSLYRLAETRFRLEN